MPVAGGEPRKSRHGTHECVRHVEIWQSNPDLVAK